MKVLLLFLSLGPLLLRTGDVFRLRGAGCADRPGGRDGSDSGRRSCWWAMTARSFIARPMGRRALVPAREPMTLDTIFDLASLTKVVATTPAIMKLFEQGKIRLNDPVTVYLPEFQGGKSDITVRDLLTHFSGLRPDLDLEPRLERL